MAPYSQDELLPLSVIADLLFCERRAALHLIEGIWKDSLFTVEGTQLHDKVDADTKTESRKNIRVCRGLLLRSLELGLSGKADVVEFHCIEGLEESPSASIEGKRKGIRLNKSEGLWRPITVEYKRGKMRHEEGFEAQVCAQALCLEEMMGVHVPEGAIYYGKPRRRLGVVFDETIRAKTRDASFRLHELVNSGRTPKARYEKKCESCSLLLICMPRTTGTGHSVKAYISKTLAGEI